MPRYDEAMRARLLEVARTAIDRGLATGERWVPDLEGEPDALTEARSCFVTLNRDGELRGCVGSLTPNGPLIREVARAAFNAAFRDPRFSPLTEAERGGLDIHVSVLSEPEPMTFASEEDLLDQLRPGVDGLILEDRGRVGTFLPDVWEKLPSRRAFLQHLRQKAGLPPHHWSPTMTVKRYTTEAFP
ncbi:MAG TPA: AmmeMemoRadiSam system protein A [Polyangiaceae bacterium]|nr:AmmeMemoRadiSam system protein A [Polyangiaceae bacterium]